MDFTVSQLGQLPSPYYRVATRAIVLDNQRRILVMENPDGEVELPGGGWEYDETFEACLDREIREELGVGLAKLGDFVGVYRGRGGRGIMYLRIAFRAELTGFEFDLKRMDRAWFATRSEFMGLSLELAGEEELKGLVDIIWR